MSYKSLLFCPDEKAAQVVTQVLSELEFTVEIAFEPFATVKKLTDEHFDALVVDCHNEQDASLLFKAARNSTHNHSSLAVAVVEGQAGVAKAFRIGANLVLTKPINVEQSKSTLRVAKGLLRKGENRGATGAPAPAPATKLSFPEAKATPVASQAIPTAKAAEIAAQPSSPLLNPTPGIVSPEPHIAAATVPYAGLEVEKDPTPETEAADLAVLESMPKVISKPAPEPAISGLAAPPQPIAASTARGAAAAAAPALEMKPLERKLAGAAPMVTNEPIVQESRVPEPEPAPSIPTFSFLEEAATRESGGGRGFFKFAIILALLGAAAYFGWQKFQPLQYLHHSSPAVEQQDSAPAAAPSSTPAPSSAAPQNTGGAAANNADSPPTATMPDITAEAPPIPASAHARSSSASEDIEVQEMPMTRDMKVPPPTRIETVQPLVVKSGPAAAPSKAPVAPPAIAIPAANNTSATLSKLTSAEAALPNPAPNTVRVSQGVSQGLLLRKVAPVYPPMALQLHKEGTVQLLATISKKGDISNVKVLSGDTMLARSAADAVLRWKYRPYLLNGNPVEIETQISIGCKEPQ
jgi:periplasmic protein TonB